MQYRLVDGSDSSYVENIFRRYSRIRALALIDAIRIVRFHMTRGSDVQKIVDDLRSIISKESVDHASEEEKSKLILETFKMGKVKELIRV